jgi:hypothetical protein
MEVKAALLPAIPRTGCAGKAHRRLQFPQARQGRL